MDKNEMLIDRLREVAKGMDTPQSRTLTQAADALENYRTHIAALQNQLDMARGERDVSQKRMILLEQENAAMLKILKEQADCGLCKHDREKLPCGGEEMLFDHGCGEGCSYEKMICCNCGGDNWEWKGVSDG